MKLLSLIYLVLATLLVGCIGKEEKRYNDCTTFSWKDMGTEIVLQGHELNLSEQITRPMRLSVSDSTLILLNNDTEDLVQLVDLNTEKKIGHYGTFGSGPADLMTPRYVHKKDSSLFIYDSGLRRFNHYIIDSDKVLKLKNSTQFTYYFDDVIMLSDSILIANVLDPRLKKISYFQGNSMLTTMGDYPLIEGGKFPLEGLAQLEGFASSLAWNTSKRKIAIVYKQTDLIEIYDETGRLKNRVQGPDIFFPSKSIKNIGNTQKVTANIGEERDAYFSPVTTTNELFVLYSGLVYHPGDKNYLLDHLFVFDWNGKPLRQYKLDIPIFRFVIDESSHTVYGLTDSPEFRIVRFNLE